MRKGDRIQIQGGCQAPTQFLPWWRKKSLIITVLRDIPKPINKTNGMAYILLISPQGAYKGKVPTVE